ncbi:hypothetical protein HW555_000694 [Spodoptera exigua]|uniref:RNA polymerase II-associated protein 1 n=1 Tax=Spodoptera exigua TaxID=7107 RepID=A0A835GTK9_SPOEX|nr:hypothetical protein HW555_000694 [Spodoptera exigua]
MFECRILRRLEVDGVLSCNIGSSSKSYLQFGISLKITPHTTDEHARTVTTEHTGRARGKGRVDKLYHIGEFSNNSFIIRMLKRPKPGEDEEDILRMQEEFLREKQRQNLQPAAAVTNLRPNERTKLSNSTETGRKPSKYAQAKGLKGQTEKKARFEESTSVVGDILEKNLEEPEKIEPEVEDDKVYYPKVIPSLLGDIVEKNVTDFVDFDTTEMPSQGFPVVTKQTSLFYKRKTAQSVNKNENVKMDVDEPSTSTDTSKKQSNLNLPEKSFILSSKEASDIHKENVKLLSEMSEQDILEERKKLLSSIDPKLVEFLKTKRQQASKPESFKSEEKLPATVENKDTSEEAMDTTIAIPENNNLWENDVLTHPEINKWLHFDSLEKDKLEWMKGIEESKKVKADEPYEARFDFNGYLLPYTMEYNEKTKPLFHHGDEPHRPGYSITELIELTRSTVTQQRVMALNTIAGIIEYYSAGTYKNVIEIPVSKLFFIIRIAMDDNKVIILEPALRAMRNLLYNRIDEASLDALIGFEEGTLQPCLENDKSEIEELQSKESEFTDYHLAEIDIMTALQRTEILQRLYYILESVKPNFNCVQYSLQILSRLARDSLETAQKIVEMEHLMNTIIKNFIPVTSTNFVFDPSIVYNGKPVLAALKFIRIMSLQSLDVTRILLMKYDLLKPISEYISSAVDRMYGLKIQIEAVCTLSNILCFGLGTDVAVSLFPVIVTALHKHVKGTDIFVESSILSATHAAVVLQLVNRLLRCILGGMDSYKSQIYPLLKEGVQKWMGQLSQASSYTCGHLRLLCSAIDCCKTVTLIENLPMKFLNDSLRTLSQSQGFAVIIRNMIPSSNLLSGLDNKDLHLTKNLMSLGGSVIDSPQKVLPILNIASPMPFLASLFNLLTYVNDKEISEMFLRHLTMYLSKISNKVPKGSKDLLYTVANKLCYILRNDKKYELDFLFGYVVFNKHWFTAERLLHLVNLTDADGFSKALTSIEDIKLCYSRVVNINYRDTGPNIKFKSWQEPILPRDWIYLPILTLYSRSQEAENTPKVFGEHSRKVAARIAAEKEFITRCSLEWILFNELCFPDLLNDIDVTDRLCRIMCVFLSDNSLFLDPKIKILLKKCTEILFKKKSKLNFDKQLVGLHNFQDFFTQFLEQFQSVSYGDPTFAACVLVPLAQRHDVKWRKLLWSEYAGCLRALDCPEEYLCYDINEYLQPEETDESLIQSYFQALSSNLRVLLGIAELKQAYEENNEEIKYVVLVNCGGTIDLVDILQPEEEVVFFVLDAHKPTDVCNVYSDGQVRLVYKDSEENIPNFDDIFRDDEEEEDEETGSGREGLEAMVEKRRERRAWEERRNTLMFNYTQFSYYGKPGARVTLEKDVNLPLYRVWSLEAALCHAPAFAPALRLHTLAGHARLRQLLADTGIPLQQARQAYRSMDVELRRSLLTSLETAAPKHKLPVPSHTTFLLQRVHSPTIAAIDVVYAIMGLIEHETIPKAEGFQLALECLATETGENESRRLGWQAAQRALEAVARVVHSTLSGRKLHLAGPFSYFIIQEGTPEARLVKGPLWLGVAARWVSLGSAGRAVLVSAPLDAHSCILLGVSPRYQHEPRNVRAGSDEVGRVRVVGPRRHFHHHTPTRAEGAVPRRTHCFTGVTTPYKLPELFTIVLVKDNEDRVWLPKGGFKLCSATLIAITRIFTLSRYV